MSSPNCAWLHAWSLLCISYMLRCTSNKEGERTKENVISRELGGQVGCVSTPFIPLSCFLFCSSALNTTYTPAPFTSISHCIGLVCLITSLFFSVATSPSFFLLWTFKYPDVKCKLPKSHVTTVSLMNEELKLPLQEMLSCPSAKGLLTDVCSVLWDKCV